MVTLYNYIHYVHMYSYICNVATCTCTYELEYSLTTDWDDHSCSYSECECGEILSGSDMSIL